MPRSRRNHDDVARLQLMRDAVSDGRRIGPGTVEEPHGLEVGRTTLRADELGAGDQRRRSVDDVIDLADEVVLGDRVWRRRRELAAMDDADADVALADL